MPAITSTPRPTQPVSDARDLELGKFGVHGTLVSVKIGHDEAEIVTTEGKWVIKRVEGNDDQAFTLTPAEQR